MRPLSRGWRPSCRRRIRMTPPKRLTCASMRQCEHGAATLKNRTWRRIVAALLVPCIIGDPGFASVGAGPCARPQSEFHSIQSVPISGGHGGPPLQCPFTSQALAPVAAVVQPAAHSPAYLSGAPETLSQMATANAEPISPPAAPLSVPAEVAGPSAHGTHAPQAPVAETNRIDRRVGGAG
jgi:hypothetical protein